MNESNNETVADHQPSGEPGARSVPDPAIMAVFRSYAEGFDDFDPETIADCFAFPVSIWQSGKGNLFADEDELAENIEALLQVFEREEIVRSSFTVHDCVVSGNAAFAALSWRQEREDGDAAMEFNCRYALIREDEEHGGDGAWRIALVINE